MSSSVCQGLQSCLEPRLVEPLTLHLKLAPLKPSCSRTLGLMSQSYGLATEPEPEITKKIITANTLEPSTVKTVIYRKNSDPVMGWSSPALNADSMKEAVIGGDRDGAYVHPLMKCSCSVALSQKSLEMCTESLGSESGSSNVSSADISIASIAPEEIKKPLMEQQPRKLLDARRLSCSRSFPPPLTSISGSTGVQIRPHRGDGRLVLEAVTVSLRQKLFHMERSEGRLRLRLWKDDEDCDLRTMETQEEEQEEIEEEEQEEIGDQEAEEVEDRNKGKCGNVRGEIGNSEKLAGSGWPSRCKEGGHGRPDKGLLRPLEPFLAAI
ncbi:hypothetical protein CRG98_019067 [Punica granatum]|nr:hypothetical protein CRG98_019067 [Punica granatum]